PDAALTSGVRCCGQVFSGGLQNASDNIASTPVTLASFQHLGIGQLMAAPVAGWESALIAMGFDEQAVDRLTVEIVDDVVGGDAGVDLHNAVVLGAVRLEVPDAYDFRALDDVFPKQGKYL
ncbi:MAG: hypothetical protein P8178_03085, partial [Candidatus Thiodiazotropha sp.]